MTSWVPSGTDQSSRDRPPLDVSPETPALATIDIMALGAQRRLQLVGKAFAGPEAEARHQAVAEADDREGLGARRRNGAAKREEKR